MKRSIARTLTATLILISPAALAQKSAGSYYSKLPPPCADGDLSLGLDDEGGAFNGMSHGGTLIVLRNIGPKACSIPRLPVITFQSALSKDLDISTQMASVRGMHPGPVMLPLALAPNAEATSTMRWVSGQVYEHGVCISPFQITINVGSATLHASFNANICGESATKIAATPTWFQLDPIWKPAP